MLPNLWHFLASQVAFRTINLMSGAESRPGPRGRHAHLTRIHIVQKLAIEEATI